MFSAPVIVISTVRNNWETKALLLIYLLRSWRGCKETTIVFFYSSGQNESWSYKSSAPVIVISTEIIGRQKLCSSLQRRELSYIITTSEMHLFGFSPLCVFKCRLNELGSEQVKSHQLHLFDFSPLCVFKCVLKWPF